MKPKKPKMAKAVAKRTRPAAKGKAPAKAAPKKVDAKASAKRTPPRKLVAQTAPEPPPKPSRTQPPTPPVTAPRLPATAVPRRKLSVPPILLEGDAPAAPRLSGPGERYIAAGAGSPRAEQESGELPEAYGTQRLLLVARDPRWLYAHWDMTAEQLRAHNASSRDGHLVVRVFRDQPGGELVLEQHMHPETRNWFLHVHRGGTKYVAQLGCYTHAGDWKTVATSAATLTPPDVLSEDTSARFETIPVDVPFAKLLEVVKAAVAEHTPLVEAIQELREAGYTALPIFQTPEEIEREPEKSRGVGSISVAPVVVPRWTPQQERALAEVINIDDVRRVWMGSLEITELIRRKLEFELASQAAAELGAGVERGAEQPGAVSSISSPFGGEAQRRGFWFNINAELIIYGATEPTAKVTIGGRRIQLRRDGSFSFRFALPDGNYDLPVQATSADGHDTRHAELHFRRATEYLGDVDRHPQDAALKPPRAENVS